MTTDSPFVIRLELLKMAQDLLVGQYHAKYEVLRSQWERESNNAQEMRLPLPAHPQVPEYPTEVDIIAQAKQLNDFISNTK